MNLIEQLFRVSPDGGSGMLELAIAFVLLAIPVAAVRLRRRRRVP